MKYAVSAKKTGSYHKEIGLPCQDSWQTRQINDHVIVAAVADGVSKACRSEAGSRIAAFAAVDHVAKHYRKGNGPRTNALLMRQAMIEAYRRIVHKAEKEGFPVSAYDTTLCMVILDHTDLYYAQSGDSGCIAVTKDGLYHRVTTQQNDPNGRVYALSSGPSHWQFGYMTKVSAAMLVTDGLWNNIFCPGILKRHPVTVNVSAANPLMERTERGKNCHKPLEKMLYRYLCRIPEDTTYDDKTAVILFDPDVPFKTREASYYAVPDWRALKTAALRGGLKKEDPFPAGPQEKPVESAAAVIVRKCFRRFGKRKIPMVFRKEAAG